MSTKTLRELLIARDNLKDLLDERRPLGSFDVNAGAILVSLEATLAILNHLVSKESEGK